MNIIHSFAVFTVCILLGLSAAAGSLHAREDFAYDSHGRRDPFIPLFGMHEPGSIALEEAMTVEEVDLMGIAMDSQGNRAAILNGETVEIGQRVGRVTLKEISDNGVIISLDGTRHEVYLYPEINRERGSQ
jgi:hypothetical protein